jgi:hypothetical protein
MPYQGRSSFFLFFKIKNKITAQHFELVLKPLLGSRLKKAQVILFVHKTAQKYSYG